MATDLLEVASAGLNCELAVIDLPNNIRARNQIVMAESLDRTKYFIKALRNDPDVSKRFQSSLTADRYFSGVGSRVTPKLLHHDQYHGVLVYEHIDGISPGLPSNLGMLEAEDFFRIGGVLAEVHVRESELDQKKYPMWGPSPDINIDRLHFLDFDAYWMLSGAELEFWRIVQANAKLFSAMFAPTLSRAPITAIHGDLRLDQFLVGPGTVRIVDWEEFSLGNPAKDVGMLCGDIFVSNTYRELGLVRPGMTDLEQKSRNAVALAGTRSREAIDSLMSAYKLASPDLVNHPEFLMSVAKFFIGHLVERVSTKSSLSPHLNGHDKAILGIALQICRNPVAAITALGVTP